MDFCSWRDSFQATVLTRLGEWWVSIKAVSRGEADSGAHLGPHYFSFASASPDTVVRLMIPWRSGCPLEASVIHASQRDAAFQEAAGFVTRRIPWLPGTRGSPFELFKCVP